MTNGDKSLEAIIAQLTSAIAMTHDARLVKLQQIAIGMRSAEQVERMEVARKLSRPVMRNWR
jgi:hypothetical protein